MDRKRENVVHVVDNAILVGQSLRGRMESFIRDREVACGQLEPHSRVWELFKFQKEQMSRSITTWDKIRVRGDENWYRYQISFLEQTMGVLGPEDHFRDPKEVGA